jgi:hypothetical protein
MPVRSFQVQHELHYCKVSHAAAAATFWPGIQQGDIALSSSTCVGAYVVVGVCMVIACVHLALS